MRLSVCLIGLVLAIVSGACDDDPSTPTSAGAEPTPIVLAGIDASITLPTDYEMCSGGPSIAIEGVDLYIFRDRVRSSCQGVQDRYVEFEVAVYSASAQRPYRLGVAPLTESLGELRDERRSPGDEVVGVVATGGREGYSRVPC
jgi:hypothetical protein